MAKRLKSLSNRVFHTLAEFEESAEQSTKIALIYTLNYFKNKFKEIAIEDIYNNAYKAKWYVRTNWLEDDDAIEDYIYKNVKNAIGGGVRFNRKAYDNFDEPFQHGNPTKYLPMESYLAIMNNSSLLRENPYGFPTHREIDRGHFYDEFLNLVDKEFDSKFSEMWERADHFVKTGRRDLRGYGNGSVSTSIGATSSSTKQYTSLNSRNI